MEKEIDSLEAKAASRPSVWENVAKKRSPCQHAFLRCIHKYKDAIKVYDDITLNKMDDFFEELVQAMYCNDEYHVSYFLLHYLHLRAGLGLARVAVRKLYPNCEKFAQIPEVKKFYMQHRGENPRSLTTLKEFSELINWLKFEGKLKVE
ncbi:hypothetical protein QR680_014773 [Steinernema hermaphroditum]|uniref:Uncharacterized protein n=1 Tax=Steinernema hermaphroditum TaxID=289476 RepID=A0AA39IA13_9BILA|nr:hypothetical protein QR680_014773 [Steinernema hermaphroditum]